MPINIILKRWWLWIILTSFLTYLPVIDNFFGWDDFLWLYRAKTLLAHPSQLLQLDTHYFDPIVYLSFWIDYQVFGLDPQGYHIVDIILHTANGILLYLFIRSYANDPVTALFSSLLFVSGFSASDAVLWPSSRVDLFATLFSLATLALFHKYLKTQKTILYVASIIAYILALCSKGTPVIMPALLWWILFGERKKYNNIKGYISLTPYVIITCVYLVLLTFSANGESQLAGRILTPNFFNYSLSLAALLIPERILTGFNLSYTFLMIYTLLLALWFIRLPMAQNRSKVTGLFMMFLFLTPVLSLGDFTLFSAGKPVHFLLGSPSHRIYLASMGMCMLTGSIIAVIHENAKKTWISRIAIVALLILLAINIYETRYREEAWDKATAEIRNTIYSLQEKRPALNEGCILVVVNAPMSEGFLWPMFKTYYNLNNVTVIPSSDVSTEIPDIVFSRTDDYFFFVKGKNEVYDLSGPFRELLAKVEQHNYSRVPTEKMKYREEYRMKAVNLNQMILKLMLR